MKKMETTLSTVVEEFTKLDLKFRNGSDLDVVERGYAGKLIHGISTENRILKCEALKSLGDLYLHKAKTEQKEHKVENYTKACVLYKEAVRYCRSKDEKTAIQYRIRYAKKSTKLVRSQKNTKPDRDSEFSGNMTLAVCVTLQLVHEKTKVKGRDLLPLIEAYTDTFVKAIVDKDNHLKVELLKSLGDLYLEKGRVNKDEAAFDKSTGLYQAAMDRCEDSDGRETLKHRIMYAQKVKEKQMKKQQKRGLSEIRKPGTEYWSTSRPSSGYGQEGREVISAGNRESTYNENIQEGCRALEAGDLDRAEQKFAAALKSVHVKESTTNQHVKETEPLHKLSSVYLKRGMQSKDGGDFTKAAALCNAALVRSNTEEKAEYKHGIIKITKLFLRHVLNIEQTVDIGDTEKHKLILKENRGNVEKEIKRIEQEVDPYSLDDDDPKIREVEENRAEAIKELCQTLVNQRRVFITSLVEECLEVMEPLPCKYAMIGLGSQATGLVTPYSDLEFAILIETDADNNVEYFRNLTHYLHLKVIGLGETILPAMAIKSLNDFHSNNPLDNWFYDSVTPRGFSFDGAMPHACKTPLGRGKTRELIQTPRKMTNLLKEDLTFNLKKGYHLASILGNVCIITGDQELVDQYTALWSKEIKKNNSMIPLSIVTTILKENAQMFELQELNSNLLNVKKEIYRFSSLAVSCWAMIFDIQPTTIWETVQDMRRKGIIGSENAHHLMVLVSISAELRLRTYMSNRGQVENMSALSSISDTDAGDKVKKVFYLSNARQLMRYYLTALPLKLFMSQFANGPSLDKELILFSNFPFLQAMIYRTLCDYENWKACAERSLQIEISKHGKGTAHPDIARNLTDLGLALMDLGDDRNAVRYLEQSLQMKRLIYGEKAVRPNIALSLTNLGSAWSNLGDHRKAAGYYEQSLRMNLSIYGEGTAHHAIAVSLDNLGSVWGNLGDYRKAINYSEQSLQIKRSIHGEGATHLEIAMSLSSLGSDWGNLGDYKKDVSYHEQALMMVRDIYGENTAHPDIALPLTNLGSAWIKLGDHRKAASYYQQSLQMLRIIYGENTAHYKIATALQGLGGALTHLGDYRKALDYYEQSLQMMRSIYGKSAVHPGIAKTLYCLGNVWCDLKDHRQSVSYHEQALRMWQSSYGESTAHPDIIKSLNNVGSTWKNLGDHKKALIYYEQSLQMTKTIHGENTAHPDIALVLDNVGCGWGDLGDHRKAASFHEQSLEMKLKVYGRRTAHSDIALSLTNLGSALGGLGDYRKAISYHEKSLQMNREIYGETNPNCDILQSLNKLGNCWNKLGDHRKAISYYEQSHQAMKIVYGDSAVNEDIALALYNLGIAWCDLGDYKKAISYHEQSLQMSRSIHGVSSAHEDIIQSLNHLGIARYMLGDHRIAASCYEQLLQMKRSIYGENNAHPEIAQILKILAETSRKIGDHKKAIGYCERSLEMFRRIHGEFSAHRDIIWSLALVGDAWKDLGDYLQAARYYEQLRCIVEFFG
uniref:Uncharacterized protein n=1 Tax=Branchiostoma floridae TaxID=7739 RepID=C3Y7F5_BRAFL|eukprot:XP_002607773.1 hypothetical protein BRAFLDRAFT_64174 [Branchiostoma floridae]